MQSETANDVDQELRRTSGTLAPKDLQRVAAAVIHEDVRGEVHGDPGASEREPRTIEFGAIQRGVTIRKLSMADRIPGVERVQPPRATPSAPSCRS